jgi:DNA primase
MDQVAQVKEKIDIVAFISGYITLKKAGRNFKANCPFHNEKSPSFMVSPDRQTWHCFGCAKGGDVYSFLMEYEKMDFGEALRTLAKRAGIELVSSGATRELSSKKELFYQINTLAKEYYHYILTKHKAGEQARAYLQGRGTDAQMIETFMIGFAPISNAGLSNFLCKKKGYKEEDVVEAGLAFYRNGRLYDFFWGRLIFPLIDHRDNVIGFSGRILDADAKTSKYINTRETLVYHKGEHMYGLNVTKDAIRRENKVIIAEGEFDVISCFQHGISNVVGVKGTALTENQVNLLGRYAEKVTFCFDGDKAGQEAIKRSLPIVEKKGLTPTVIDIPGGKDPDEALKNDAGLFKKAVNGDIGIYDYLFDKSVGRGDSATVEGKKRISSELLPFIAVIKNEIVKEHYLRKISSALNTSYESISKELGRIGVPQQPKAVEDAPKAKRLKEEVLEEYLLALLVQSEKVKEFSEKAMVILSDVLPLERAHQKIIAHLSRSTDIKALPIELLAAYDTCILFPLPQSIDGAKVSEEVEDVAQKLKLIYIQQKMKKLAKEIDEKEAGGEDAPEELKVQYSELAKQLDTT